MTKNPFPVLTDDLAMRAAVAHKDEIKFMPQANGTTVCSYIVSMEATFDDPFSREARGIVFNQNGQVIGRPLHKFFNVNEKPSTLIDALDWTQVARVMDKRDGSMIHTVALPADYGRHGEQNFTFKSKKSYESSVAVNATKFVKEAHDGYVDLCSNLTMLGKTAIFEWTSPYARIVLAYNKDDLQLLHVRDNVTGEYMSREELEAISSAYSVPLVNDLTSQFQSFDDNTCVFDFSNDKIQRYLMDLVETTENVEGWIFQFANGDMVKLKTKWYMERHRAMTFLRQRDIALMVLRESLDDLKALLVGEGANIAEILEIEADIVKSLNAVQNSVEAAYEAKKYLDRKDFALFYKGINDGHGHPYFALLMQKYSGREPDYKGWYERTVLPTIPLRQLNLMQSEAEAE